MALSDVVRSGVALANRITGSLQVDVRHRAWIGKDGYGKPVFAAAVLRPALVEKVQRLIKNDAGEEVLQTAAVTFISPIESNGATGRKEPIDPRDVITLPDGSTGTVIGVRGLVDPSTSAPYMIEVSLG